MMTRKIYNYKDVLLLDESVIAAQLEAGVIITATTDMSYAMKRYYKNYAVLDIHQLLDSAIPQWSKLSIDLTNYIWLRNMIDDYIENHDIEKKNATSLRRNTNNIWDSIRLLIEADVCPEDFAVENDSHLRSFKDIWKLTEYNHELVNSFRKRIVECETTGKNIDRSIKIFSKEKKLFLMGFYFITPIQERIFRGLEKIGYEIAFLNSYDLSYPIAHSIWDETYSGEYDRKNAIEIQEHINIENSFGEAIQYNKRKLEVQIITDSNPFEFAKRVKGYIDSGELIFSPDDRTCNELLEKIYPELNSARHFLSYPVGQYVYYLHKMWDEIDNCLNMSFEYVYKCFASGWLASGEINGRYYLYELKRLEVFLKGCNTFDAWKNRIEEMRNARKVVACFENDDMDRYEKLLSNPFRKISAYSVGEESIEDIIKLLVQLMKDAEDLFGKEEKTMLHMHLSKIEKLISTRMNEIDTLSDEEKIANEFLERLKEISEPNLICSKATLRDAITSLIGNRFDENDDFDKSMSSIIGKARPLMSVESAILDNDDKPVHLVMADETTLPGGKKELPWPLSEKVIHQLIDDLNGKKDAVRYLKSLESIRNNRPLSNRYLFYTFMDNARKSSLTIEWIDTKEGRKIDASPYVYSVGYIEDGSIISHDDIYNRISSALSIDIHVPDAIQLMKRDIPEEVVMDYIACPLRYTYGYLLNEQPEFSDDFHYSRLLTQTISAMTSMANEVGIAKSKYDVAKEIYKLFPFFRKIELKESTDYAKGMDPYVPFEYKGNEYPVQRLLMHFLDESFLNSVKSDYHEYLISGEINVEKYEKRCMYCPYKNTCIEQYN